MGAAIQNAIGQAHAAGTTRQAPAQAPGQQGSAPRDHREQQGREPPPASGAAPPHAHPHPPHGAGGGGAANAPASQGQGQQVYRLPPVDEPPSVVTEKFRALVSAGGDVPRDEAVKRFRAVLVSEARKGTGASLTPLVLMVVFAIIVAVGVAIYCRSGARGGGRSTHKLPSSRGKTSRQPGKTVELGGSTRAPRRREAGGV